MRSQCAPTQGGRHAHTPARQAPRSEQSSEVEHIQAVAERMEHSLHSCVFTARKKSRGQASRVPSCDRQDARLQRDGTAALRNSAHDNNDRYIYGRGLLRHWLLVRRLDRRRAADRRRRLLLPLVYVSVDRGCV